MSISIRKKYIKYNNEKILRAQSKEANFRPEKNYKTNTYINPKFKINEKNINSNQNVSRETPKINFHIKNNLRNNTKVIPIMTNFTKEENKYNHNTNDRKHILRRNYSSNIIKKRDLNDVNDIISVILEHEAEKVKINLLRFIINGEDINIILRNFSERIEDLICEYNINNSRILNNEENKIIIENKYQIIKDNIMQEYFIINKDIYTKYFLSNKKEKLDKLMTLSNFVKHCTKCNEIAMHKSRNPLYLIPNTNYVICKETNEIYDRNHFESFCEFDGEIYISSCLTNYNNKMYALTNRNSLEDEKCLCMECRHILYYSTINKKIKCIKCNFEELDDYNSIFYNEIFFSKLREEINFSLIMKRKSNPSKYCSCGGICYKGKFLEKYILVCSKCRKCQYDIRNGRYKYKLYLIKKNREEQKLKEKKIFKKYKNRNQNNNHFELKITSESNSTKENQNNIKRLYNNHEIKEINLEKNKISIMPKAIMNFSHFTKTKNNKNNNALQEENKENKEFNNKKISKDLVEIKRELVIKKAKLLLLNNSLTEKNENINNLFLISNPNKTVVASRKIRALNGYNLDSNNSNQIKQRKINKFIINSLDEKYNKVLEDKSGNKRKETKEINIIKKTLTNNNSYNNININRNIYINLNKNNFSSTNNLFTNKLRNTKKIPYIKKYNLPCDLSMSDYKIISIINSSSFSTVYKVQELSSKKYFAIKKTIFSSKSHLEKWKKQLGLLQILNHAYFFEAINILPLIQYGIKKLDNMSYAIYELMPLAETDLDKKISKSLNNLTQIKLIKILKQLINALCYMQEKGIAHRDINPGNIFEINGDYYIGDFDQSIKVNIKKNNLYDIEEEIKGSEAFLSPILYEALIKNKKRAKHNLFKSDVYSLGLCFVYALTKNLFVLRKIKEIKSKDKIKLFILQNIFEKKFEINNTFLDVIAKMITMDEKFRPDFIELNNLIKENKL